MPQKNDQTDVVQDPLIAARLRVLEVSHAALVDQSADIAVTLRTIETDLARIASDTRALRDTAPIDFDHLEAAADVILASDSPRMVRFWKDGHSQLVKHSWDRLALAIGHRILAMIVTAALVASTVWAVLKGGKP